MGTMTNKERDLFSVKQKKRKKNKDANPKDKKIAKKDTQLKYTADSTHSEPLSYESLVEGQVIFGCIREVHEFELVVSLPHRIVGYIPITNISKSYTKLLSKVANEREVDEIVYKLEDLYFPGQFITTQVKNISKINNKIKVVLSLEPKYVNSNIKGQILREGLLMQCACKSTEDNGFIMETGISSVHGAFLPKLEALAGIGVGSSFPCRILSVSSNDEGNVSLKLSAIIDGHGAGSNGAGGKNFFPFPGEIIDTKIKKVTTEGLLIEFNGWDGLVSNIHLFKPYDDLANYRTGQSVKARVLFISNLSRVVHLSINKVLCSNKKIVEPSLKAGDTVDNAKVYRSSRSSILFKLPGKNFGFCSSNQIKDGSMTNSAIKKAFPSGTVKQCRILQFSIIDQMYIVSLKKSLIQEKILGMKNLEIGQIHSVVIKEFIPAGAIVAVSQHLDGFVPRIHLTDSNMANPEVKLPVGKTVQGRILRMEPGKQLHFTLKSALVDSQLPILKEVTNNLVGTQVEGIIAKINLKGLLVEFYNELKGFVPKRYVGVETLEDLTAAFKLGQCVKCQVLKVYEDDGIMLTMIDFKTFKQKNKEQKTEEKKTIAESMKLSLKDKRIKKNLGGLINCVVTNIDKEQYIIHAKSDKSSVAFEIPMFHLSDNPGLSRAMFIALKEGDKIEGAVIFRIHKEKIIVSLKPFIRQWSTMKTKARRKVSSLEQGDIFPCVVDNVQDDKLEVISATGKFGLVNPIYKSKLITLSSSMEISDLEIVKGQTLMVNCVRLPLEWKAILSAKFKDVLVSVHESSFQFLLNYLLSVKTIKEGFQCKGGDWQQLAEFSIGELIELEVKKILSNGVLGLVKGTNIRGVIQGKYCVKQTPIGSTLKTRVLFVNFEEECLELCSILHSFEFSCPSSHDLNVGDTDSATIILIKPEFILARMLKANPGQVVYLPSKRHLNDFTTMSRCFVLSQNCEVVVKYISGEFVLADIADEKASDSLLKLSCILPSVQFENSCHSDSSEGEAKKEFSNRIMKCMQAGNIKPAPISKRYSLPQFEMRLRKVSESNEHPVNGEKAEKKRKRSSLHEEKQSLTLKKEKGFIWKPEDEEEESIKERIMSDSEDEQETRQPPPKKTALKVYKQKEKEFEDILKKSPDLVLTWINYANYYLEMSQVDEAREVLRRGLSACTLCAEEDQLQLWRALLSVEESCGAKGDLDKLVKEATTSGGASRVSILLILAELYVESNKLEEAESIYKSLLKKHSKHVEVWLSSCAFHLKQGRSDVARKLFDKALVSLPKEKSVSFISQNAELEFNYGDPERAIEFFESLVKSFPAKLDLWLSYYEILKSHNRIDSARKLLERMCKLKLPIEQMRTIFLKMQTFETEFGTPDSIASLKERISNYILSLKE